MTYSEILLITVKLLDFVKICNVCCTIHEYVIYIVHYTALRLVIFSSWNGIKPLDLRQLELTCIRIQCLLRNR